MIIKTLKFWFNWPVGLIPWKKAYDRAIWPYGRAKNSERISTQGGHQTERRIPARVSRGAGFQSARGTAGADGAEGAAAPHLSAQLSPHLDCRWISPTINSCSISRFIVGFTLAQSTSLHNLTSSKKFAQNFENWKRNLIGVDCLVFPKIFNFFFKSSNFSKFVVDLSSLDSCNSSHAFSWWNLDEFQKSQKKFFILQTSASFLPLEFWILSLLSPLLQSISQHSSTRQ